ncbi:MAG: rod shape-determining protein MreD [Candidatus Kappaea frigidicola]|nr:rod shape-determining protein MreD [Candidatus Kappaea frigidicola]
MSKKKTIIVIILTVGSVLAQISFLNYFAIFGIKPDLVLALVVFFSLFSDTFSAFLIALFAGLACDIFSAGPFGLNIFIFLCIYMVILFNKKIIDTQDKWTLFLVSFAMFILSYILYYLFARADLQLPGFYLTLKSLIIPAALYTLVPFYILYFVVGKPLKMI